MDFVGLFPALLQQLRNQRRPAGLMAGAESRAVVAVEIFVEQHVIAEMRIALKFLRAAKDRPPPCSSRRNRCDSRRDNWHATSPRFIFTPDPVGNSTCNSSPK